MFPLAKRLISGYEFGEKTWYTAHHLGVDYAAPKGTKLYAPFDGFITSVLIGAQGGKTIWFKPKDNSVVIRFMHLSEFKVKTGDVVKEGQIIGLTGNTGSATTGAHLHIDISKKAVNLNNFANFLDPEKYKWEQPKIEPEIKKEVKSISDTTEKPKTQLVTSQSVIEYDDELTIQYLKNAEELEKLTYVNPEPAGLTTKQNDQILDNNVQIFVNIFTKIFNKVIETYKKYRNL